MNINLKKIFSKKFLFVLLFSSDSFNNYIITTNHELNDKLKDDINYYYHKKILKGIFFAQVAIATTCFMVIYKSNYTNNSHLRITIEDDFRRFKRENDGQVFFLLLGGYTYSTNNRFNESLNKIRYIYNFIKGNYTAKIYENKTLNILTNLIL